MRWVKIVFSALFFILAIGLLGFYWFFPSGTLDFNLGTRNYNFSVSHGSEEMQFYENMRFPLPEISYKILDCPLQKEDEMEYAFEILSNISLLNFYQVGDNEEISVTCDSKNKMQGGLFIAGEGGPTNITRAGEFSVIRSGKILLIRESKCEKPNIALHELLHVLGFKHSLNKNNIMYNISKCNQIIGEDTIRLIDELYSYPSYPDLVFENVSAKMTGRFLDTNITIRNNGLDYVESAKLIISVDGKEIKEVDVKQLQIGFGRMMVFENIFVSNLVVNEIEFYIEYDGEELEKENNKIKLEIKSS